MSANSENKPFTSAALPDPFQAWKSSFDYAFGFPIELMLGLFGLRVTKKD